MYFGMRKIGGIVTLRTFQWTSGAEIPVDIMLKGEWGPCRYNSVADPGFAVGWDTDPFGGGGGANIQCGCFSVETCQNERIGSHNGGRTPAVPLDPPMVL